MQSLRQRGSGSASYRLRSNWRESPALFDGVGANPFDYLTQLERHARELAGNPSAWMPWNYRDETPKLFLPISALLLKGPYGRSPEPGTDHFQAIHNQYVGGPKF